MTRDLSVIPRSGPTAHFASARFQGTGEVTFGLAAAGGGKGPFPYCVARSAPGTVNRNDDPSWSW